LQKSALGLPPHLEGSLKAERGKVPFLGGKNEKNNYTNHTADSTNNNINNMV
jgi:hypothetical protein